MLKLRPTRHARRQSLPVRCRMGSCGRIGPLAPATEEKERTLGGISLAHEVFLRRVVSGRYDYVVVNNPFWPKSRTRFRDKITGKRHDMGMGRYGKHDVTLVFQKPVVRRVTCPDRTTLYLGQGGPKKPSETTKENKYNKNNT